jgi:hypothetical protein
MCWLLVGATLVVALDWAGTSGRVQDPPLHLVMSYEILKTKNPPLSLCPFVPL